MTDEQPVAELDARYSGEGATAVPWARAEGQLRAAEVFWLSTVRPDGRPHVTPLLAVWLDGSLFFCTGPAERKARNLVANPHCVLTTGRDTLNEGFDVVVEGDAVRVTDDARLVRVAEAYESKYGSAWRFGVRDGAFYHDPESLRGDDPGQALVYEVAPGTVFGFGKGEFSQTRWRFR
jgi:nitroimidazol reductase NimA-like FMN-containing flavoprotein (pyridoxamine 5'-phosphate oxidase superfamily)